MPKYLFHVNYVGDGIKGLMTEGGTKRKTAADKAIKSLGGKMEAFYFAFGETDAYVIADLPDNAAAATVCLAVGSSGVATARTTVLMTPAEMDATRKAAPDYRAPGK
jgi:uncharacterized protein with GYD domain